MFTLLSLSLLQPRALYEKIKALLMGFKKGWIEAAKLSIPEILSISLLEVKFEHKNSFIHFLNLTIKFIDNLQVDLSKFHT